MHTPVPLDVQRSTVTFAGTDDRGNCYLGDVAGWSGHDDVIECRAQFWPCLDPGATRLELALTGWRSRAVIDVPLGWNHEG
jgi:hypothetical protein